MKNHGRVFLILVLAIVVGGCSSSETEQVARLPNADSPATNRSPVAESADTNAEPTAPRTQPDKSPAMESGEPRTATPANPDPPPNPDPPVISSPPEKTNPPETNQPDAVDAAGPDPDPDTSGAKDAVEPGEPPPFVPSGKMGTTVGDTIPAIDGKDVEGVSFQLSDYEGKVLMIDFWGDW